MRRVFSMLIVVALILGGCSTENRGEVDTGTGAPEEEAPAQGQQNFPVGQKVKTKSGNFVTLHVPAQSSTSVAA